MRECFPISYILMDLMCPLAAQLLTFRRHKQNAWRIQLIRNQSHTLYIFAITILMVTKTITKTLPSTRCNTSLIQS